MYIPLKVTTDYSLLRSLIKVKDLVNFCVQNKISSCAICDKNLFGVIEFYKTCLAHNIKPIIGLEIDLNEKPLYLYAKNYEGYKNLLKINTIIGERKISVSELKMLSDNLLAIVPYHSLELFDDVSFIENRYIGYENDRECKNALVKDSHVVYIRDIKCFQEDDQDYLKYLDKIRGEEENYYTNYFDFKITNFDEEKMEEVSRLLNVTMPREKRYIPEFKKGEDSYTYLANLALRGLKKRLNNNVPATYVERLKYELSVIKKMGFVDYFLIVYDYVLYAKKNHILVGPGRGSAAGSLVSYVIGITDIDPVKYNLLFERFLNPDRITMPDIDIDFDSTKRDEVISYVKSKYGEENVSGGMTFSTLKTRLVLREVASIFNINEKVINKFLKVINKDLDLKNNLKLKIVQDYLKTYPELKKMYEVALHLEGLKKNISTHAAGIVIANKPLDEIIPMYKNNEVYLTGVPMEYLEDLGLLKMDFLGLKNLSIISKIVENIPDFNILDIPLDDQEVFDLFSRADTDGIFQFETTSFKSMLIKYRPQSFAELIASIALVRPGPSRELETYIKRKNGQEKITYYHESLEDILKETYGVIVYQEQIISILVKMANFSYAEADNIRRAMSKKKEEILKEKEKEFLLRCQRNGYEKEVAQNIYNHILSFASYGFNKAHSVSYAYISYLMAYLKVHYKALFTFAILDGEANNHKFKTYLNDLKKNDYEIKSVSLNLSSDSFVLRNKTVYLPFSKIQNFRSESIKNILKVRNEEGLFKDVYDFFKRTYNILTKGEYRMLILAGALDEFNINAKTLINNLDVLINYGALYHDLGDYALIPELKEEIDFSKDEKRENEINSYGFYISNHPASKYNDNEVMKLENIKKYVFKNIVCYVMIEDISLIKTKKGEDMGFISASDETGTCDFTIFPNNFALLTNLAKNDMIKVWGNVSKRYDKYSIIINRLVKE